MPYSHLENPEFAKDAARGFMGISLPTLERLYGSLFAPWLGLFFWAPWMALALAAPFRLRRNVPGMTACAVVLYYRLFQTTLTFWRSGWVIGPRYITPPAAIAIFLAIIALQWAAPASDERSAARFFVAQWEPSPPPGAVPF